MLVEEERHSPAPPRLREYFTLSLGPVVNHLVNKFLLSPTMCLVRAKQRQDGLPAPWELAGWWEKS